MTMSTKIDLIAPSPSFLLDIDDLFPARWEMSASVMTRTKMIFSSPWRISLLFVRSQSIRLENFVPSEESDRQWNPPRWSLTKLFLRRISSAGHWICHCSPIVFPFSSSLEMQCSFVPDGFLPIIQFMSPRRMKFLLSLSSMSFFPSISRSELKITMRRVSVSGIDHTAASSSRLSGRATVFVNEERRNRRRTRTHRREREKELREAAGRWSECPSRDIRVDAPNTSPFRQDGRPGHPWVHRCGEKKKMQKETRRLRTEDKKTEIREGI